MDETAGAVADEETGFKLIERMIQMFWVVDERDKEVQMEINEIIEKYKNSQFYEKYKNTYISDVMLREAFSCELKLHRLYGLKTYSQVHQLNIDVMKDLISLFANPMQIDDEDVLWKMVYTFYLDPDSYAIKKLAGIECTADGLFSIKRIYRKYGLTEEMISEYARYRKVPIFFFPQERNGINMSRSAAFGDRIDYTLFDLKNFFEEMNNGNIDNCKLSAAYKLPKTSEWLKEIHSFENLVDWYGIKGIFVSDNYGVFDLEKGNGECITDYAEQLNWWWSDAYYDNLKKLVDKYMGNMNF